MNNKIIMGGGAVLVAILIALTAFFSSWPEWLHYIWALLVLIWGLVSFK